MGATGRDVIALWASAQAAEAPPGASRSLVPVASGAYMVLVPGLTRRKLRSLRLVTVTLTSKPSRELFIAQEVGQIFPLTTGRVQEHSTSSLDHPRKSRSL